MSIVNKIELVNNLMAIFLAMIAFAVIGPSILEDRRMLSKSLALRVIVIMITETAVMMTAGKEFAGVYEFNLIINYFNMFFNMVTTAIVAYHAYRLNEYRFTKSVRKDHLILSLPIVIGCIFLVINLSTGVVFTVDSRGFYVRNSGAFIINGIMILYSILTVIMVLLGKNKERNYLFAPILVLIIPIISGILIRSFIIPQVPVGVLGGSISLLIFALSTRHAESCFDPLTMAYNEQYFPHYMKRINKDPQAKAAGIMIYVEDFAAINDKYGHEAGDDLILKTVELINDMTIKHSALLRLRDDVFILLINITDLETIRETMFKIREKLSQYEKDNREPYSLSLSMGMTIYIPGEYTGSFIRRMNEQVYPKRDFCTVL